MRGVTWVLVEEVKSGQWSIGGQPLSTADVKAMAGRRGGRLNNHPQGRCGQAGSYAHAGEGVGEVFRDNGSVPWGNGQPPKPRILTPSTATTAAIGLARPRTQLGRIGDAIRRPCRLELGPAAAHGRGNGSGHDLLGTSGRSPPSGKHELSAARAPPAVSSSRTRRRHTGRHTARSQHEDTKESPRPRSHHDPHAASRRDRGTRCGRDCCRTCARGAAPRSLHLRRAGPGPAPLDHSGGPGRDLPRPTRPLGSRSPGADPGVALHNGPGVVVLRAAAAETYAIMEEAIRSRT